MFDLLREIGQTLSHNKLRLALTGFAVAWGIFMLVVLLGMANGLVNSFRHEMMSYSDNIMTVWGGVTSKSWRGFREGRHIQLKNDDVGKIEESCTNIDKAWSAVSNDTITFRSMGEVSGKGYEGVYPQTATTGELDIVAGRFINDLDMQNERKVVVLPSADAMRMFGTAQEAVGKRLESYGISWIIIGVYEHRWRTVNYIPYTTASSLDGHTGNVGSLFVHVDGIDTKEQGDATEQDVRATLSQGHTFDPTDESAVWIWNRFSDNQQAAGGMQILLWAMWAIGILTLLSGIVGVSNIMFVSVKERTHEIGIRRAIGARRSNILWQVVFESVAITTIFGYIGIVAGTAVTGIIKILVDNNEFLRNPGISLSMAFGVTVILVVAGMLAGLFPALKATKVKPVEALRDE